MILLPAANVLSSLQHFCVGVPFVTSQSGGIHDGNSDALHLHIGFLDKQGISIGLQDEGNNNNMARCLQPPAKKNAKTLNCGFVVTSITF